MTSETSLPALSKKPKRRGVVIVAVLVVVVLLSLAGYQYSDLMLAEYKASENAHRSLQARAFADSGIHYAAALLSNPDNYNNILNSNPWNNPQAFQDILVPTDNGMQGRFSVISPPDPDDSGSNGNLYGVLDEGGKINLNAIMLLDPTGQTLHDMLVQLPNMTDDIAYAIIDWIDADSDTGPGGAENDYYGGLSPPYQCKNGPIDSIDELLLVKGVTWALLYGSDYNRNGAQDNGESNSTSASSSNGFDRGWSAYLTANSREQNYGPDGNMYVNLNGDLTQLYQSISTDVSEDMAKFIVLCRQNGVTPISGNGGQSNGGNTQGVLSSQEIDLTKSGTKTFTSIFQLLNAQVSITTGKGKGAKTTLISSPLNDASQGPDLMNKLYSVATLSPALETPARININTAPSAVLATLSKYLTQNDVQNILSVRPKLSSTDPPSSAFQSPAWLYTQAQIKLETLQKLDPYITTRSQVYRVQSIGYFDGKGPAVRVEAIIDTNGGRPRILAWRNLSELGKGWNNSTAP